MTEFPLRELSELYHGDAGFRAAVDRDARAALAARGVHFNGPGEVRLAANSEETTYVVFPPAPNASVPDGALDGVAGGAQRGVDWDVVSPGDGVRRRAQPAPWWSGLHGTLTGG